MAASEQRLEHLRFHSSETRPQARAREEGFRLIAVLVGFAALVAWGIVDQPDHRTSVGQAGASSTETERPRYDGRGKWGGYLPQ